MVKHDYYSEDTLKCSRLTDRKAVCEKLTLGGGFDAEQYQSGGDKNEHLNILSNYTVTESLTGLRLSVC